MKSISGARKRSRGRPRIDATPVNTRFPPDELAALDAWIAHQREPVTRPEAVRQLVGLSLKGKERRQQHAEPIGNESRPPQRLRDQQTRPRRLDSEDKLRRDRDQLRSRVANLEMALKGAKTAVDGTDAAEVLKLKAKIEALTKDNRSIKAVMKGMVDRKFLRDKEKLLADLSAADFRKIAKSLHPDTAGLVTAEERNEAAAIFLRLQRLFST